MKDSFSAYHPIVNFVFYGLILGISMFFMHPVLMTISALGALSYVVSLKGKRQFLLCLQWLFR